MGYVREKTGIDLTGGGQRQAAQTAARIQSEAGQEAIDVLRGDLQPFMDVGGEAVNMLLQSIADPQAQDPNQILNDPFFQALAQQQEQGALANRAALGLAGSGGTQDVLQRNLLQLGNQFQQQNLANQQNRFNQLFNVAGLGQSSAAQTGAGTANLLTGIGSVQSTVPLAAADVATQQGSQFMQGLGGSQLGQIFGGSGGGLGSLGSILGSGGAATGGAGAAGLTSLMGGFSDERLKENAVQVGADDIGGIYEFNYIGDPQRYKGRMAQELLETRPDAVSMHESGYYKVTQEFAPEAI
jgi:hypothetical protein